MAQNGRPSSGDLTGKIKAQNERSNQADLKERDAEISMMNTARVREESSGIFDPKSGAQIDSGRDGIAALVEEGEEAPPRRPFFDREPTLTGKESPEAVAPIVADRRKFELPPEVVHKSEVVIRVESDIEDMTYGMTANGEPNNFTFREGLKYKVSIDLAEHLNKLGLVRQFVNS